MLVPPFAPFDRSFRHPPANAHAHTVTQPTIIQVPVPMPARQAAPIFISQPAMVAPPTLGKKVTAEQLQEFDEECKLYFHRNNVSNAAKVKHIAYAIAHPAVCKFYLANINRSHRMTYEAFLAQARRLILGPQWEKKIRCEMMLIYQGDDAFDGWYQSLSAMNNCIAGTLSFLDDDGLRVHLQAHAHVDLQEAIDTNDYDYEPDFALWIAAVSRLDDDRRRQQKLHDKWTQAIICEHEKTRPRSTNATPTTRTATAPSTSATDTPFKTYLPSLCNEERVYLKDHDGCNRCRKLNVGGAQHWWACKGENAPTLETYKPFTKEQQARVDKARAAAKTKKVTVAVATVSELPSAVLGEGSDSDESYVDPFYSPHYFWECTLDGPSADPFTPIRARALIDNGSSTVLIKASVADALGLKRHKLPQPLALSLATNDSSSETPQATLTEWVKIRPRSVDGIWQSRRMNAIVAPTLCADIILGNPFLSRNHCIIDHLYRSCTSINGNYDLLRPVLPNPAPVPKSPAVCTTATVVLQERSLALAQLLDKQRVFKNRLDAVAQCRADRTAVAHLRTRIEALATVERLGELNTQLCTEFADRFPVDIPHTDDLPTDIYHRFQLKDASLRIQQRQYSNPRKYHEAWRTLLQQHLDAGRIRPSSSPYASPAFIIPKADPTVLP